MSEVLISNDPAIHSPEKLVLAPCLIILSGLPATGKTTLGREMVSHTNAFFIDIDDVRKKCYPQTAGQKLSLQEEATQMKTSYYQMFQEARALLSKRQAVVLAATFSSPISHQEAEELAQDLKVPLIVFLLEAPSAVLLERTENRKTITESDSNVMDSSHLYEVANRFHPMRAGNLTVLDTTCSIDEKVKQILVVLENHLAEATL